MYLNVYKKRYRVETYDSIFINAIIFLKSSETFSFFHVFVAIFIVYSVLFCSCSYKIFLYILRFLLVCVRMFYREVLVLNSFIFFSLQINCMNIKNKTKKVLRETSEKLN